MRKLLLTFISACAALSLQAQEVSDRFDYEYEGRTLHFQILYNASRTCETQPSVDIDHFEPPFALAGNPVEGPLTLPSVAVNPENGEEYRVVAIGNNGFYVAAD